MLGGGEGTVAQTPVARSTPPREARFVLSRGAPPLYNAPTGESGHGGQPMALAPGDSIGEGSREGYGSAFPEAPREARRGGVPGDRARRPGESRGPPLAIPVRLALLGDSARGSVPHGRSRDRRRRGDDVIFGGWRHGLAE